jgi:hypothetical protein
MSKVTDDAKKRQLTVYLPDTRGVTISRFGIGNLKIGLGVFTYSRLPGSPARRALGLIETNNRKGTCPGSTQECESICYASRPVAEQGPVYLMWERNSANDDVPMELPPDCKLLRLHISGDFTSQGYINGWYALLATRPDVTVWAYTRSWRVAELLPALERLRALPNVQLFASVDSTTPTAEIDAITTEHAKAGRAPWRLAWIDGDHRGNRTYESGRSRLTVFSSRSFVCPEETGHKANCVECRYCFDGKKNDVTFLKH